MYKKILVAYDGSEGSQAALDHASNIATHHESTLIIAHAMKEKRGSQSSAYTLPYGGLAAGAPAATQTADDAREETDVMAEKQQSSSILRDAKKKLHLADSQVQTETLHGEHPAKEICEFADTQDVDLIVMGNRGLHGVRKLMLGSVSQKVAQNAHCPVLIVK